MKERNILYGVICILLFAIALLFLSNSKQNNIDRCIEEAEKYYNDHWDETCSQLNLETDCMLPINQSNDLKTKRENDKNRCIERYK